MLEFVCISPKLKGLFLSAWEIREAAITLTSRACISPESGSMGMCSELFGSPSFFSEALDIGDEASER